MPKPAQQDRDYKAYGVVTAATGGYSMAIVAPVNKGGQRVSVRRLPAHHALRCLRLMHRGVYFGIPCTWTPAAETNPREGTITAPGQGPFMAACHAAELRIHEDALADNLTGVVGNDAFLATIPLEHAASPSDSFVSVFPGDTAVSIGVVVDRCLVLSMTMAPVSGDAISGHLLRIKKFWNTRMPSTPFPGRIFILGAKDKLPPGAAAAHAEHVSAGDAFDCDETSLRAIGVAYARVSGAAPQFSGPTRQSRMRASRAAVYIVSAALAVLAAAAWLGAWTAETWYEGRKESYSARYHQAIKNNREIRALLDESNKLAVSVRKIEDTFSRQTPWTRFLDYLGRDCPAGLRIESLGSQPDEKDPGSLRIALSGWTSDETAATRFIAALQKMPFLSGVSLASMEREKKNNTISQFRIVCLLDLRAN